VREHWLVRTAVGMAMVPRGEVGLIFAGLGHAAGILNAEIYAGLIMVVAYTTLFSPFWIKLFYRLFGDRPALTADQTNWLERGDEPPASERRADTGPP